MTIDEQLKQIKTHNGKTLYDVELRRTRITALVLATATIVSLIFLVFAFVQKAAADLSREQAIKNEVRAVENETRAKTLEAELQKCQATSLQP